MDRHACPACERGTITPEGICDRCAIGVARGVAEPIAWPHRPRHRQDQDRVGRYTDYVRTKEDKA
jgi:hypothetical protein